jgi:hypothetical protein
MSNTRYSNLLYIYLCHLGIHAKMAAIKVSAARKAQWLSSSGNPSTVSRTNLIKYKGFKDLVDAFDL